MLHTWRGIPVTEADFRSFDHLCRRNLKYRTVCSSFTSSADQPDSGALAGELGCIAGEREDLG